MAAAEKLDDTLLALADPTRRKLVELLRKEPRRAGELAAAFDMVPPAMSRHLRILRRSGLVEERPLAQDARVRVYRLRSEPFFALQTWLQEFESFWSEQLDSFKTHVEAAHAPTRSRPGTRAARSKHRGRT